MTTSGEPAPPASPLSAAAAALRGYWKPFLLIQLAAVLLAVAFHTSQGFRAACAVAAGWKVSGGLPFASLTGAIAGGVLPELAKLVALGPAALAGRAAEIAFNVAFFALNGVVIDLLYGGEAHLFGDGAAVRTVAEKVAFDQFVFSPTWLAVIVVLFLWRQRGFSWAAVRLALGRGFYQRRVVPLLLPNWLFWIPMVSIIYALPVPLQFLMFIPALGAWSLIVVFIATEAEDKA